MKRLSTIIFLFLSLFFTILSSAQELKVKSMEIMPDDLSARTEPRADNDGNLCALLKIYVMDKITKAQGAVVGDVVDNGIEKWIYVPDHTKQILLNFENHFPLKIVFDDYKYHTVSERMTYVIKLVEENENTPTVASSTPHHQTTTGVTTPASSPSTAEILAEAKKYYDEENFAKAMELFKKIDGDKEAQNYIGLMYVNGQGVPQDYQEAAKWFRKAAEQGNADAQRILGWCYEYGHGVELNYIEAFKFYKRAAEQGDVQSLYNIGCMYNLHKLGKGGKKDYSEAFKLFQKAGEEGHSEAQYQLGVMYYLGQGVKKDLNEAVKWYRKAAEQGYKPAKETLQRLGY